MKIPNKLRKQLLLTLFCMGIAGLCCMAYSWTFGHRGDIHYFKRQTGVNLSRFNNVKFFHSSGFPPRGGYVEATCQIPLHKIEGVIKEFGFIQYDPSNLDIAFLIASPPKEKRFALFRHAPENSPPLDENVYFIPQKLTMHGKYGFVAYQMVLEKDTGTFWGQIIFK